jgi:hypothetical protein
MNISNTNTYPHINVEETFDEIVRAHGGAIVLRDKIGKSPDFANADYIFHFENVIAELKCLMDDNSESPSNQAKINTAVDRFYAEGKIKTKDINEDNWPAFPAELQNMIYDITSTSLRNSVKKANLQIRETKAKLGLNTYTGMLIIVNDGVTSFPPAAFVHATLRVLERHFSEINCFIFTAANVFSKLKGMPWPTLFWIPMQMEKPGNIDEGFINRLRIAWQGIVNRKIGAYAIEHQMRDEDMEAFWKAKNLPR